MIRKIITVLCVTFLTSGLILSNVSALEPSTTKTFVEEKFEDWSYIETIIVSDNAPTKATTRSGKKTSTFKGSDGTAMWSITVNGKFTYNGKSATCTSSIYSKADYSISWKLSNAKASKGGATASASVTAKQYHQNGSVLRTINRTVKLTCSPTGSLY